MVNFLNDTFAGLDGGMFRAMNGLAKTAGGFFTPIFEFITLIGEKGLIFFAAALVLALFSKTRKLGICTFGAVACGALLTNIILKDAIARPRPFLENAEYFKYWLKVGAPKEDGYSFPSGHMTAITAAMTALFILCNKKWSWVGFIGVFLMGVSRIYLIAHYTTDVLAGIVVGGLSGVIAFFITKLIYSLLNKYKQKKFCAFVLDFDLLTLIKKKKPVEANAETTDEEQN